MGGEGCLLIVFDAVRMGRQRDNKANDCLLC